MGLRALKLRSAAGFGEKAPTAGHPPLLRGMSEVSLLVLAGIAVVRLPRRARA